jgi:hypothetical protein
VNVRLNDVEDRSHVGDRVPADWHPETMLPHEVESGRTYQVRIASRDNPAQYLTGDPWDAAADLALLDVLICADSEPVSFDLTVTGTGRALAGEPAVEGVRVKETSGVRLPLPPAAAERLGLPPDVEYVVEGMVREAATGREVSRPAGETVVVPVRWLHGISEA